MSVDDVETLKVVFLGDNGVDKRSIISCFANLKFDPYREASLSPQFQSKTMEFPEIGKSIKFDMWDTVGHEKYSSMSQIFYKDADIIIFVYDIAIESSFEEIKNYWYKEVKAKIIDDRKPIFALVVHGVENYQNQKVSNLDGKKFADEIGAIFQTTSVLLNSSIITLFENIGQTYLIPGFNYKDRDKARDKKGKKSKEKQFFKF